MDFTNPLTDNDETENGGRIKISSWKPFITKRLDPLRMNPPDHLLTPAVDAEKTENGSDGDKDNSKQLPALPADIQATREQKFQDWILQQTEMAQRTCIKTHEGNEAGSSTSQEDFDDDLALSPRILDAGVELAILDPNLIRSGVSLSAISLVKPASRASWSEKEVYCPEVDTGFHPERTIEGQSQGTAGNMNTTNHTTKDQEFDDATTLRGSIGSSQRYSGVEATAVSARIGTPVLVRNFGEEMRRMEQRYRNWVPEMTSRSRLIQEMQREENA